MFATSGRARLAYDMRGFGETTYERDDGWSQVAHAVAVLDAAGFERPLVVASSMGARNAIDLTLAHPERVAGPLLIGTAIAARRTRTSRRDRPPSSTRGSRRPATSTSSVGSRRGCGSTAPALEGVGHVPQLEAGPATPDAIAEFVDAHA